MTFSSYFFACKCRYFSDKNWKKICKFILRLLERVRSEFHRRKPKIPLRVTFFTCYAELTLIISHVYAMQINLHLVIAILVTQHSAFFSTRKSFSLEISLFCVFYTHTVSPYSKCFQVWFLYLKVSRSLEPALGTRPPPERGGGRRALAVSWCWGWGWRRPTKTKNTTLCHILCLLSLH